MPGALYLDTETTGLAGGTGTYVFLVGLASWHGGTLTVTQYFLGDLDGEAALLHAVAEAIAGAGQLVTFNGRTFDLPLLETRYLLARATWWGEDIAHYDLYPVARALWHGRAADCRLTTLESALLGVERGDDLPGALVPQVYFRFLRTRDPGALPRIFAHNRWDLVALAGLHARAAALLRGPAPRTILASGWERGAGLSAGSPIEARASTRRPSGRGCRRPSRSAPPGGSGGSGGGRAGSPRRGRSGRKRWRAPSVRPSAS